MHPETPIGDQLQIEKVSESVVLWVVSGQWGGCCHGISESEFEYLKLLLASLGNLKIEFL